MEKLFIKVYHRDRWLNGFLSGIFLPFVLFAGFLYLFESLGLLNMGELTVGSPGLKPRTLALTALCINVVLMQLFKKLRWTQSMRGLAVSTFICVVLWLTKYGKDLF